jgi:hypothetical protein
MKTYVIKANEVYKIGKSKNVDKRIQSLKTALPNLEIIHVIEYDVEKFLHKKFENQSVGGEWFTLSKKDLEYLCTTNFFTHHAKTKAKLNSNTDLNYSFIYDKKEFNKLQNFECINEYIFYTIFIKNTLRDSNRVLFTGLQIEEVSQLLNVSTKSIRNYINSLIRYGLIKKIKSGNYEIL